MDFSSPDDLDRFITVVRRELQASGFHDAADILAKVQTTAFTTSSEWLGELGLAVKQIRRQQKLPAALDRQLTIIMNAAGGGMALKDLINAAWRFLAGLQRPSAAANARRFRARGETLESLVIREAAAADIPALARLHVTTWNATYAPLLLNGPSVAIREQQWREAFARNDGSWFCFVVERPDGELVGFAKGRKSESSEFGGELNKIYLLRDYQRLGLGRALVGRVARRFLDQGITSMWLFGDARNPSRHAWVAMGATKTDNDPGNGNYGWRDLKGLTSQR